MGLDEAIAELKEADADPEEVANRLQSDAKPVFDAIRVPAFQEGKSEVKEDLETAQDKIASLRKEKKQIEEQMEQLEEEQPEAAELKGQYEEKLQRKQERINELEKEKEQTEQEYTGKLQDRERDYFRERAVNFLVSNGVVDRDIAEIKAEKAMADRVKVGEDGQPKVYEPDGDTPMPINGEKDPHEAFGESLLDEIPDKFVEDNRPGSTGMGQPGTGESNTVTRSKWDEMSQAERYEFSKEGGEVVDG